MARLKAILLGMIMCVLCSLQPAPSVGQTTDSSKVIESFHVKTDIRYRFATTQMVSVVRNRDDAAQEIPFKVTLPKGAFIVNFSMTIDGKEYVGEVKEKHRAKQQYQAAVEAGQSAGYIKQAARHSNVFEVSVNVANGTAVTFTLTYQELLRRKLGIYEHEIHVTPGQAIEDFSIETFILENRNIPVIRTPALRKDVLLTNEVEAPNNLADIKRPTPQSAHITFAPTLEQQGDGGLSARFAVQYEVDHADNGEVLVADGYFLHFYAPDVPPLPKDIIFVLDVSGSMTGNKIRQLQRSMATILKDLHPEDRFNIATFSNEVKKWKRHMTNANEEAVKAAIDYVNANSADGGTDINTALLEAVKELREREWTKRMPMIFFLTDGEATSGETRSKIITSNVRHANNGLAAIFGLAFGNDADFNILKKICGQNSGFARKIYEASDSALQVSSLYEEISAVAMKNVSVNYLPGITKTTKTDFPVVFNGSEIVICGGFEDMAPQGRFEARISGIEKSGNTNVILNINNVNEVTISTDDGLNPFFTIPRDFSGIVEKMWAFLTVKQLLKEQDRVVQEERKAEKLKQKILLLSLKYNFVTPLTSMVVTKPGDGDGSKRSVETDLEDGDAIQQEPMYPSHHRMSSAAVRPGTPGGQGVMHSLYSRRRVQSSRSRARAPRPRKGGAVNRKKGGNNRRRRRRRTIPILWSMLFVTPSFSMCVAPRKILGGSYLLFKGENGQPEIELITECAKKCRLTVTKLFRMTYAGDRVEVLLNTAAGWSNWQGRNIDVRLVGRNLLNITTPVVDVVITHTTPRRKMLYDIEVVLKTDGTAYDGLLSHLHKKAKKGMKRRRKVTKSCRMKKADFNIKLKANHATGFLQATSP